MRMKNNTLVNDFDGIEQEQRLSFQDVLNKVRRLWPWMLFYAGLTVAAMLAYLYFSTPVYQVKSRILIKNDDKKGAVSTEMNLMQSMGMLSGVNNVNNELEIIQSYALMQKVVKELQLNVRIFQTEKLRTSELYGSNNPFQLYISNFNDAFKNPLGFEAELKPGIKSLAVRDLETNKTFNVAWGDSIALPVGTLIAMRNSGVPVNKDADYSIKVIPEGAMAAGLTKALKASIPSKQTTIIDLSLEHTIPARGEKILSKLVEVYMMANVEDHNIITDSSIAFIDARLAVVGNQLNDIESEIQFFKQRNAISDLGAQAKALIETTSDNTREEAQQMVVLSVIESLEKYMTEQNGGLRVVPASLIVQDPTLTGLVNQYNGLLMQRSRLLLGSTESNPMVLNMDGQLRDLRADILQGIASVKRGTQVALNALRTNTHMLEARMRSVPEKERVALDFSRQQNIRQELYLFLLQKREEAAISRSSTVANARIIDAPRTGKDPIKPRSKIFLGAAMLLGLIIPIGFVSIRDMLNTRLVSRTDIEKHTNIPIVGEIGHIGGQDLVVAKPGSRAIVAEQFRALRTNLQFLLTNPAHKTILVTSGMGGEGKTVMSVNLAAVLAIAGKRVVLLELDLRKPRVSKMLQVNSKRGFTNFAIGKAQLHDLIVPSGIHDNFVVLPSGPLPPNPTELLLLDCTTDMFKQLEQSFDYIIIDTTPQLVTDALILSKFAHATLYIVRANVTSKDHMALPNTLYAEEKLPRMNLVVNDINQGRYGGGYYGYGYQYGSYVENSSGDKSGKSLLGAVKKGGSLFARN